MSISACCRKQRWISAALVLVFVIMQSLAVVHASEHPFHETEISCENLHAVEKSKTAVADYSSCITVSRSIETIPSDIIAGISSVIARCYLSRAPPVHS